MLNEPIIIEQNLPAAPADVWDTITNPNSMRQWYFEQLEDFKPVVGFKSKFDVSFEGTTYGHWWVVSDVHPQKRIAYRWRYSGLPGDSLVRWTLHADGDGTLLRFAHEVNEPFPEEDPNFSRTGCQADWNYFITDRLVDFLKGHAP